VSTTCPADCGTEITFFRHERTGNVAPIELLARADGNVTIDFKRGTYHVMTKAEREAIGSPGLFATPNVPRYVLHFADCPNAPKFRRCQVCHKHECQCGGKRG
jgi:hypothetical protein